MGTWLIFQGLPSVTAAVCCLSLLDWRGFARIPGNSSGLQTVPETDTGGLVEYTKALEITVLKELGKMPP